MLVYGDPQFQEHLSTLVGFLRQRLRRTDRDDLEALRSLVILIGQLEQGLQDYWSEPPLSTVLQQSARATDLAAAAFHRAWHAADAPGHSNSPGAENSLDALLNVLDAIPLDPDPVLTCKIPEGFEFYALFPEQYCASARTWAAAHAGSHSKRALVVGIRSIGTTLSALLKATLETAGWQIERCTVRPGGHPYDRRVELSGAQLGDHHCALVVDEGPGISGSSMAAVARTLAQHGVSEVSFFPGHQGPPGIAASLEVRRCWAQTPCYFTPLNELRWQGHSLAQSLSLQAANLSGHSGAFDKVQDCSGGLWRPHAFAAKSEWPAVAPSLERMKFRCGNGRGSSVLWKFAGFGSALGKEQTTTELASEALKARARQHLGPAPLGSFNGFIALPWVEGRRLRAADAKDPAVLNHLGHYLAATAGPPLTVAEARASQRRLAEILYWNTREACGERLADRAAAWVTPLQPMEPGLSYSDGRMAPHEWICTSEGHLLKTDTTGHQFDHTCVGEQSLLWDVAGVVIEWNLESAAPLLPSLQAAGIQVESRWLMFHQMAYAAFRLGVSLLFARQSGEARDRRRLQRASAYYRERLTRWLEEIAER